MRLAPPICSRGIPGGLEKIEASVYVRERLKWTGDKVHITSRHRDGDCGFSASLVCDVGFVLLLGSFLKAAPAEAW